MENNFKYIYQHEETGRLTSQVYSLERIESSSVKIDRWYIIKRLKSTEQRDVNDYEIYNYDILKNPFIGDLWEVYQDVSGKWCVGLIPNSSWIGHDCEYPQYAHTEDLTDVIDKFELVGNHYETPEMLEPYKGEQG
jgi:hypothetical protein